MRRHQEKLTDILAKIQNSPAFANQDIMTFSAFMENDRELLNYVKQKRKFLTA